MENTRFIVLFIIFCFAVTLVGLVKNQRQLRVRLFGPSAQTAGLVKAFGLQPIWKKDCTEKQIENIFEKATLEKPEIMVDCSFNLEKSKYKNYRSKSISKRLIFEGVQASNIHIHCGGAGILPLFGSPGKTSIQIQSKITKASDPLGKTFIETPENILIENCRIQGSIQVTGGEDGSKAPTKIVFDRLVVSGFSENPVSCASSLRASFYLAKGVHSVFLVNSVIRAFPCEVGIYLGAGSTHNVIRDNDVIGFQKSMIVDGSGHNVISNNHFSGLQKGGVFYPWRL